MAHNITEGDGHHAELDVQQIDRRRPEHGPEYRGDQAGGDGQGQILAGAGGFDADARRAMESAGVSRVVSVV